MRWWSILWPVRFWYGYAGDATPDSNSLRGIGNSRFASTPGSLKPYYSAALTVAEARRKGLTPAVGPNGVEHASGEEFTYNGKTYRWDDTFNGDSSYVDIYAPDRSPDKGVSAEQIAHDRKLMSETGIAGGGEGGEHPSAPPFKGVTYEGPSKPPAGAVDQGHEQGPQAEAQDVITSSGMPTAPEPVAEPPDNAVKQSPVSQDEINQIKAEGGDPDAAELGDEVIDAHSAAVAQDPNDQRVTRRINPDTGSNKIVGSYFVPGDPVHEQMLANLDPVHRAKLPVISQAIQRGGPFSFLYGSAQQEGGPEQWQGERPTGESRQYEQALSSPEQRLSGETQQQSQRVSLLPMQMMMSQGGNPLVEGFSNDAVMNNGAHLMAGAQQAKLPVPYNGMQDPNLHKDVMGFLENQAHGYMGDGTPMVDENGQPHPLFVHNQSAASPYIPRLLQRPAAEFVHGMLNIRQPKNPKAPTKPPGFGERAAWQRRVNEGYAGQKAGFNSLLHKLDTHLPQVGMRNKKGKVTRQVPWSEGTLEPTWRAYRPELMSQLGAPPIGTSSMRDVGAPEQVVHRAPHFRQTLAQYEPHQPGPAPIGENPEVGAPLGEGGGRDWGTNKPKKGYEEFSHTQHLGRNYTIFGHLSKNGNYDKYYAQDQFGETTPEGETEEEAINHAHKHARGIYDNAMTLRRELEREEEQERAKAEGRVLPEPGEYDYEPHPPEDPDEYWITHKGRPIGFVDDEDQAYRMLSALEKGHITPKKGIHERVKRAQEYKERLLTNYADATKGMSDEELNRRVEEANDAFEELPKLYEEKMGEPLNAQEPEYPHEPLEEEPPESHRADWWKSGGEPLEWDPGMGAPAGTPNAPGQSGLLSGGDVGAEAEPEEFGSVPGGGGGMDFASPSVREGMTMNMAKYALRNPQKTGHEGFKDFNNRLEQGAAQASGAPAPEVRDAIGSWADGAENSLRTIYGKQDRKTRKLVNAIRGLHSAQKQVLNFHYDDEGPHSLTSLAFHHDNPQAVADLLDKHGLQYRTLEAPGKGERVWAHIVDTDGSLYPKLEKLIKGGHVADSYYRSGHADFIGDPNGEDREEAAREYARVFQEARSEADQGFKGRGKPSGAPRPQEWWEPFAQEAQLNYDKLKQGDELKKQQLAKDLKAADADRQNITPQRAQELEQIRSTAQAWVDKNPKLHNLAVHHYLPGGTESLPEGSDNEAVATHFEKRNPRLDYSKDADRKKAALAMTHDIMRNLAANPKSYGWYDSTVDKAMDKIAEVAPEIKTDPAHAMALRLAMAVTSQGQKVVPNFESAYKIYRYWKENGKFPVMDPDEWKDKFGGGTKRDAMIKNFDKLNKLWDKHKLGGLKQILETPISVGDLKQKHDLKVSGEAVDHELPGAALLGPKIGIFYSNLNKIFHHTTMDLWFSRTLNRLGGNMFKFSPDALQKSGVADTGGDEDEEEEEGGEAKPSQLERLERAIGGGATGLSKGEHKQMMSEIATLKGAKDLTRLKAMKLAPTLTRYVEDRHKFYQKGEGYEGSYPKALATEENRAAKNIDLNFHGLSDAPRTSTERKQWRQVMDEVDKNLKGAGLNVNAADKQALLWYLEQGLFQGPNAKSSMDYLDAAHILARKVKNGEV